MAEATDCALCNYVRHHCPGCGIDVDHGTITCDECGTHRHKVAEGNGYRYCLDLTCDWTALIDGQADD